MKFRETKDSTSTERYLRQSEVLSSATPLEKEKENGHGRDDLLTREEREMALDRSSTWMSNAALDLLSDALGDELLSFANLRQGLRRSFKRLLQTLATKTERVVFLQEAIPGFIIMAVRKDPQNWSDLADNDNGSEEEEEEEEEEEKKKKSRKKSSSVKGPLPPEVVDEERDAAVQCIVEAYINRTGNRVIVLETFDLALILFPVEDMKKNLRDMGFWGE